MEKKEVSEIRHHLGKTQLQMAQLLGVSLKAIQSFEQGWRNIPVHIERQVLFLWASKKSPLRKRKALLGDTKVSEGDQAKLSSMGISGGNLCWFTNGTICQGQKQASWEKKMKICRQCKVFRTMLPV